LAQLYREARWSGFCHSKISALATARVHATEEDHARALEELERTMSEFLGVRRTTPAARANQRQVLEAWTEAQKLLQTIPSHETLADFCRLVENFRAHRPQGARARRRSRQSTRLARLGQRTSRARAASLPDLFARQYAWKWSTCCCAWTSDSTKRSKRSRRSTLTISNCERFRCWNVRK
jgi:hypothetical protein